MPSWSQLSENFLIVRGTRNWFRPLVQVVFNPQNGRFDETTVVYTDDAIRPIFLITFWCSQDAMCSILFQRIRLYLIWLGYMKCICTLLVLMITRVQCIFYHETRASWNSGPVTHVQVSDTSTAKKINYLRLYINTVAASTSLIGSDFWLHSRYKNWLLCLQATGSDHEDYTKNITTTDIPYIVIHHSLHAYIEDCLGD